VVSTVSTGRPSHLPFHRHDSVAEHLPTPRPLRGGHRSVMLRLLCSTALFAELGGWEAITGDVRRRPTNAHGHGDPERACTHRGAHAPTGTPRRAIPWARRVTQRHHQPL